MPALTNLTVLLTRPPRRAAALAAAITAHGGRVISHPVLTIAAAPAGALAAARTATANADLLIFTSVPAAQQTGTWLRRHQLTLPAAAQIAAIGAQTAAACADAGLPADFIPQHSSSEGLLTALRGFTATNKTITIFRGQSGRETLKTELTTRGAQVRYVQCYRRQPSRRPIARLLARWQAGDLGLVTISSVAVLDALLEQLGTNQPLLHNTPILAYGNRVATHCQQTARTAQIITTQQPDDAAVLATIVAWQRSRV